MTPVVSEQHCIEQSQFFDINFYCLVDHKVYHHSQDEAIRMICILREKNAQEAFFKIF